MRCVETSAEPDRQCQNNGEGLTDPKAPKLSVILLEGESMSLSDAKSQVRQFLMTPYLVEIEDSPAAASGKVASIKVLTGVLDVEADWN